jgi:hypothetical protein
MRHKITSTRHSDCPLDCSFCSREEGFELPAILRPPQNVLLEASDLVELPSNPGAVSASRRCDNLGRGMAETSLRNRRWHPISELCYKSSFEGRRAGAGARREDFMRPTIEIRAVTRLAFRVFVVSCVFVAGRQFGLVAQQDVKVQVMTSQYSGADGLTHFKTVDVPVDRLIRLKGGVMFQRAKPSPKAGDFHPGPFRRYVVTLSGAAEIVGSSGEKFIADRDHILLVEDTTGKGHTTRIVGPDDWVTLMVELDEVTPRDRLLRVCQPPLCTPPQ